MKLTNSQQNKKRQHFKLENLSILEVSPQKYVLMGESISKAYDDI